MAKLREHKGRWRTAAAAGAVAAVLVAGTVPAVAAGPGHGVARGDRGLDKSDRELDKEALRASLAGLPDENVTGGLIRMSGTDGRWSGTAGPSVPSADAHFRIGSVTKIFTSTVLLQLAAEGRLTLDDTVQELMPGLLPPGYYPVTVGQLLSHTSGLQIMTCATEDMSPREAVDASLACGEPTEPGRATRYNGINYFIAGLIIEQVTGHTYGSEVRTRILTPLRLRDTYVPALDDWSIPAPYTRGLVAVPDSADLKDVSVQNPYSWAEGGMISNAPDLARFFTALYRGRSSRRPSRRTSSGCPPRRTATRSSATAGSSAPSSPTARSSGARAGTSPATRAAPSPPVTSAASWSTPSTRRTGPRNCRTSCGSRGRRSTSRYRLNPAPPNPSRPAEHTTGGRLHGCAF
ncbi:serine hydrolase [Streptomyces sp. NBC_00878]|uniref:serine hydrolase domain-containing protein n=1 Tax=Streptomyces sp. NBC_00878 TaxID=2975854 RepID=UPI002250F3CA|nr:serine hydrolase domain-containing protein [Streptomyces sp. NBC_00878]MCX4905959.1 beta-lactamase family protein [Streptomyces sp. NBC_00878]